MIPGKSPLTPAALIIPLALCLHDAHAIGSWTSGHMDVAVRLEAGNLVGFWKNDAATVNSTTSFTPEYDASEIRALAIFDSQTPAPLRPFGSQWDFLGVAAGEPIYILPASGIPDTLPYLGFSTEHPSISSLDPITFTLPSLSGPTGSTVTIYTTPSQIHFQATPLTTSGSLTLLIGDHQHFNWSFSHMGIYHLTINFTSGSYQGCGTYRFDIVPEPTIPALLVPAALLLMAGFRLRRRAPTATPQPVH